ncbi:hypothetical protein AciX8_3582 [Granulicella mallensis MP5ACTX8]|uniref:Uncharacterized protein n=2 Tax=Granulicella mallensis TaxID=940614 RepID=G8NYA9_GRAMM|nr:hypothetical protein AciX8_3582 [Granulicella mallensis MP5ACTX8]
MSERVCNGLWPITVCVLAMSVCLAIPVWGKSSPVDIVNTMVARELDAQAHKEQFDYLSVERSDRTGGRAWTEHVVETPLGRVRFLIAEDGKPLSANRDAQERGRLAYDLANPLAFEAREKAQKDDEAHARQMLELLPKAFLLENMREEGSDWRIDFRPSPNYSPSGIEEKILYGMNGYLLINRSQLRLHAIEGSMPRDVNIGFGFLATIHAGSSFSSLKAPFYGQWRTVHVLGDIRGKAALFKSIAKNQDVTRSQFHRLSVPLTLAQAVALAEQPSLPCGGALSSPDS